MAYMHNAIVAFLMEGSWSFQEGGGGGVGSERGRWDLGVAESMGHAFQFGQFYSQDSMGHALTPEILAILTCTNPIIRLSHLDYRRP